MKKFFALMLVVAMLSVAGIASATSLAASSTTVTVERGSTTTVTLTGTASHNGTLSYSKVSGPEWATVNASTGAVTISPASTITSATSERVVAMVTETFSGPEAGHGGTATDTARVTITVNVTVPVSEEDKVAGGGSKAAEMKTEEVKTITRVVVAQVKVINITIAAIVTPAEIVKPSVQLAVVKEAVVKFAQALRDLLRIQSIATAQVKEADNITVVESVNYDASGSAEANKKNLEKAAARLKQKSGNNTKRAIGVVPPIKAAQSGLQPFDLPTFDKAFYGKKPGLDMGKVLGTGALVVSSSFFAADTTGGNEAIFIDSTGTQVDVIPDGTGSADAGVLTAIVYVEEGAEYEPIITTDVTAAEEASFDADTGSETVASVEVAETKVETVQVNKTATFDPIVDDAVVVSISSLYGKSLDTLPTTAASTTATWAADATEKSYMAANNLIYVCALPVLENVADGAYVAKITFDTTPPASADKVGIPAFYANGVSEGGAAKAVVYTESDGNFTAISDGKVIKNGLAAYLVFEVANGAVVAASEFEAAATTISKPALVVEATESGHEGGGTSGDKEAAISAIKAIVGSDAVEVPASAKSTVASATITADNRLAVSNDLYVACRPSAYNNLPNGKYIDAVTFSAMPSGRSFALGANFILNLNGVNGTTGGVRVFTSNGTEVKSVRSMSGSGYIAFVVSGDEVTASNVTMSNPSVTAQMLKSTEPTDPYGNVYGVGSSSGGCSAGSAVLALAVLGAFIKARKK